jgi:hypothetical protein
MASRKSTSFGFLGLLFAVSQQSEANELNNITVSVSQLSDQYKRPGSAFFQKAINNLGELTREPYIRFNIPST